MRTKTQWFQPTAHCHGWFFVIIIFIFSFSFNFVRFFELNVEVRTFFNGLLTYVSEPF